MGKIALNVSAPDFSLQDFNGTEISLSDFQNSKNIVLIFNRGFT